MLVAGRMYLLGVTSCLRLFGPTRRGEIRRRCLTHSSRAALSLVFLGVFRIISLAYLTSFWRRGVLCGLTSISVVWHWRGRFWCTGFLDRNHLTAGLAVVVEGDWFWCCKAVFDGVWFDGCAYHGASICKVQGTRHIVSLHFPCRSSRRRVVRAGWECHGTIIRDVTCGTEFSAQPYGPGVSSKDVASKLKIRKLNSSGGS